MRPTTTTFKFAITGAFAAGLAVASLAQHVMASAHAEQAPLTPMMIDLSALTHADLPATGNPDMHAKLLVNEEGATIALQSGNVAKHVHANSNEIQYIIEGSGAMWLGGERKEFKPGTLIIIPKGTAHGGTIVSSGPVKAIAIKTPPQAKGDQTFVN